jgi:hypothetical protein
MVPKKEKEKQKEKEKKEQKEKLNLVKELLDGATRNLKSAFHILKELTGEETKPIFYEKAKELSKSKEGKVIEGIFDGINMIGSDKKEYPVPPNYISKSKLLPGDILKLTIAEDGSFIFKQIKPVERKQVIGVLAEEDGKYKTIAEGKTYNLILAAVTYFKVSPGDELTLIIPKKGQSKFAAIENKVEKVDEKVEEKTKKDKK